MPHCSMQNVYSERLKIIHFNCAYIQEIAEYVDIYFCPEMVSMFCHTTIFFKHARYWQEFLSVFPLKNCLIFLFPFQMNCSTVQKASPQRFSASTSLPWKGIRPTSSEQSSALCGYQTRVPRGMNSGLSSTRCVKVPFPCPFTKIRGENPPC